MKFSHYGDNDYYYFRLEILYEEDNVMYSRYETFCADLGVDFDTAIQQLNKHCEKIKEKYNLPLDAEFIFRSCNLLFKENDCWEAEVEND